MARTKSSRGVAPFKLRSGESPLPLFKGIKNIGKKLLGGGIGAVLGGGGGGGGSENSIGARLDRIEQKLDQGGSAGGAGALMGGNQNIDPAELAAGKAAKEAQQEQMLDEEV